MSFDFISTMLRSYKPKIDELRALYDHLNKVKRALEWQTIVREDNIIPDWSARNEVLSALYHSLTKKQMSNDLKETWQKYVLEAGGSRLSSIPILSQYIQREGLDDLYQGLSKPAVNLTPLPFCSFFLHFEFTLAKPYISRDDKEFCFHENPLRKDTVFKVPVVSPSSWKGNLHWTTMKLLLLDRLEGMSKKEAFEARATLIRLFGHEKENGTKKYLDDLFDDKYLEPKHENTASKQFADFMSRTGYVTKDGLRQGRLIFYPTFFDQIGLDVINPHDRKTKAGTVPILLEIVPGSKRGQKGATGIFSLLYMPFDLIGKSVDDVRQEVQEDLQVTLKTVGAMMLTYGFSAKKTSGYGVIEPKVEGKLWTNTDKIAPQVKWQISAEGIFTLDFEDLETLTKKLEREI